jgi:hypothetical protein
VPSDGAVYAGDVLGRSSGEVPISRGGITLRCGGRDGPARSSNDDRGCRDRALQRSTAGVADGQGAEIVAAEADPEIRRVGLAGATPFLLSGLDIDGRALDGVLSGAVASMAEDIQQAGGYLEPTTLAAVLQGMFVTGALHERERARREAAGDGA